MAKSHFFFVKPLIRHLSYNFKSATWYSCPTAAVAKLIQKLALSCNHIIHSNNRDDNHFFPQMNPSGLPSMLYCKPIAFPCQGADGLLSESSFAFFFLSKMMKQLLRFTPVLLLRDLLKIISFLNFLISLHFCSLKTTYASTGGLNVYFPCCQLSVNRSESFKYHILHKFSLQ
jgi:hypothetical protein